MNGKKTPDIEGTCSDCKWWLPDESQNGAVGECRGGLPVVFPMQARVAAPQGQAVAAAIIPRLTPPDYFCKEWEEIPGASPIVQ